ncbi:hypothetical protein ACHAXT_010349 [Thalassiosira profunda]
MTDFFSRIFAIPSDVSSCSDDGGRERRRKRGHSRSLTPLSLTDGNGTMSQSFGEATLSFGGESGGRSEQIFSASTSSGTMEERLLNDKRGRREHQRRRAPSRTDSGRGSSRGRQRRNDSSAHRSASEPRRQSKKGQRSSSMVPSSSPRHGSARNMQLDLNSPTKKDRRHRSASQREPRISRVNSWSSGEKEEYRRRSSSAHKSPARKEDSNGSGRRPKFDSDNLHSSGGSKKEKRDKKERKDGWRSKLAGGMKKHLSPGAGGTPPQKVKGKGGKKKHRQTKGANNSNRLRLPSNGDKSFPPPPINVGESIVISQHYLEENAEMSVLTMPKELASIEVDDDEDAVDFDSAIQEVGQQTVMSNDRVQAYLDQQRSCARREYGDIIPASSSVSHRGPIDEKIGAYASRVLGRSYRQEPRPPPPPPPPPPMPLTRHGRANRTTSQQLKVALPHSNTPADSFDPPGPLVASPTMRGQSPESTGTGEDPPGDPYQPFDEGSSGHCVMERAVEKAVAPQGEPAGQRKAVTFSLPPPSASSRPPAPPFMGPEMDYYFSMERNPKTALPCWASSPVLPPIIELWSPVEGADISGGSRWNTTKENELLGERLPLKVSQEWINVCKKERPSRDNSSPGTHAKQTTSKWKEDTPHDEHYDDILNCGPSKELEVIDGRDANMRHRSTWNTAYQPPKAFAAEAEFMQGRGNPSDWQRTVRIRNNAAIVIQKSVRGLVEREHIRRLLDSVLVLQPFVRRYIVRKRHLQHMNLRRSYYPRRWQRINKEFDT